ncbi:MAG: hypothetical protein BAJATHORv1_40279 [Candidatus Thorarchaeota archaeon]|nr:MAG: hypothetical protein BAJATHORv1_40279 [Candidatus Thorarchaeota archaeon]
MGKEFTPAGINEDVIILDFEHYGGGQNCQTSALQRQMNYYRLKISEPMLVGIGSGLGFIYWYMKRMHAPFAGGMNSGKFPGLIGRIVDRLGGSWKVLNTASVKRAHIHLKSVLEKGQPVFICADMAYLPHLMTGEEDHFGQHTLLVVGIDEPKNEVYLSDRFDGIVTMPLSRLQQARASKHQPFPAKNQMLHITFPENLPNWEQLIPFAIKDNSEYMLNPPIKNMGCEGMRKWARELPKYPGFIENSRTLVRAMMEHYIYIETGGSGGALFRRLYSDFLSESADILKNSDLRRMSREYAKISDIWTEIANAFLPEEFEALGRLREIQFEVNEILETKGIIGVKDAEELAKEVPSLIAQAAEREIVGFQSIIEPIIEKLHHVANLEENAMEELTAII